MKKHLLFDFDGVIVNSFDLCFSITKKFYGLDTLTHEEYRGYFKGNIYEQVEELEAEEEKQEQLSSDDPWFIEYTKQIRSIAPVAGMKEVIESLSKEYSMTIISSSLNNAVSSFLEHNDMRQYFDDILGADTHKSKVIKIRRVMEKHAIKEHKTVFVTDTLGDIREATKVGIASLGVTWGFHPEEYLQQGTPKAIISSPKEMIPQILNILQ